MKRCGTCLAYKRRHPYYFYRRPTSKDGYRSECKTCENARAKRWQQENPERERANHRARNAANPTKNRTRAAAWAKKHPERALARTRNWMAKHKEERSIYLRQWHAEHPTKKRDYTRTREARKAGAPQIEAIALDVVFLRDRGICSLCHQRVPRQEASIDHIIPLARGGAHTYQNVALAHRLCNARKSHRVVPQQQRLF